MTEEQPWRSKERLETLFYEEGMSQRQIAEKFGCAHSTIGRWMRKFDISPGREPRTGDPNAPWKDEETLRELYHNQKLTVEEVAEELGCGSTTVASWMDRLGVEKRDRHAVSHLPASVDVNSRGYARARSCLDGKYEAVKIHRLVAVAEHGFDEVADKVVHHKNGCTWDNRPENLEVMTAHEHATLHGNRRTINVEHRTRDRLGRFVKEISSSDVESELLRHVEIARMLRAYAEAQEGDGGLDQPDATYRGP